MTETREEIAKRLINEVKEMVRREKEQEAIQNERPTTRPGIGPDYMYDQFGDIYER